MTKGWKKTVEKPKGNRFVRLTLLFLLCGAAGFLLWQGGYLGNNALVPVPRAQSPAATQAPSAGGETNRRVREEAYDKDIATLEELSRNQGVDAQTREDAARQLAKMVAAHETEVAIEAALEAAGFSPCLTLLQNGALTVMIQAEALTATESATILSLCVTHADVSVENIRIMMGQKSF